jgi:hypothetical protein
MHCGKDWKRRIGRPTSESSLWPRITRASTPRRKKEIEAHFREKKTVIYDTFLKEFFKVFHNPTDEVIDIKACAVKLDCDLGSSLFYLLKCFIPLIGVLALLFND